MRRGGFSISKRQRAEAKAEKKRAREARRWRRRQRGPAEDEIVSAEDVVGELPSIAQAMRHIPGAPTQPQRPRGEARNPVRLFVGRLSWDTTVGRLRRRFEKLVSVRDVVIAEDRETGRSRGFGFVELENSADAEDVIAALDGTDLDGRQIVVNLATERSRRRGPDAPPASAPHARTG